MKKSDFIKFIKQSIKDVPIEMKVKIMRKIQCEWIPQMVQDTVKNYTYCQKCGKYSLKKDYKKITVREERYGVTYQDAAYGYDDLYGTMEYLVDYSVCPNCSDKKEIKKYYIRTIEEHDRCGNKK